MKLNDVVFLSACRLPVGTFNGSLSSFKPRELGKKVILSAVKRAGANIKDFEHVVMGNVIHTDQSDMYVSRAAAIDAGLPHTAAALTVNRLCGSGLQSLISSFQMHQLNQSKLSIAGGVECMSGAPYWSSESRFGAYMGNKTLFDPLVGALTCPINNVHMGVTAEKLAEKYGITRQAQDEVALLSQLNAKYAISNGRFDSQITPVVVNTKKTTFTFCEDEHVKRDSTIETLQKLPTVFKKEGTVTAGNSSGLNDGAGAVVMARFEYAASHGLSPMAKMHSYTIVGVEPEFMGIGPVPAINKLLKTARLSSKDIDVWEINEAFAAQIIAVCQELNLDMDSINPNGSGIALGHPIGATGTILTTKAIYELKRINGRYGVISMCIGGGQGIAILIENL